MCNLDKHWLWHPLLSPPPPPRSSPLVVPCPFQSFVEIKPAIITISDPLSQDFFDAFSFWRLSVLNYCVQVRLDLPLAPSAKATSTLPREQIPLLLPLFPPPPLPVFRLLQPAVVLLAERPGLAMSFRPVPFTNALPFANLLWAFAWPQSLTVLGFFENECRRFNALLSLFLLAFCCSASDFFRYFFPTGFFSLTPISPVMRSIRIYLNFHGLFLTLAVYRNPPVSSKHPVFGLVFFSLFFPHHF